MPATTAHTIAPVTGTLDIATALLTALRERRLSVAFAESVTGGALSAAMTAAPGTSHAFRGGAVVYSPYAKTALAGVDPDLLATFSTVAPETSLALAVGIRERLRADIGLGITGNAGPDAEGEAPVGTIYLATTGPGGHRMHTWRLEGERGEVVAGAVRESLSALLTYVESLPGPAA